MKTTTKEEEREKINRRYGEWSGIFCQDCRGQQWAKGAVVLALPLQLHHWNPLWWWRWMLKKKRKRELGNGEETCWFLIIDQTKMVCCNNSLETLRWQLMMMLLPLLYYLVSCFSLSHKKEVNTNGSLGFWIWGEEGDGTAFPSISIEGTWGKICKRGKMKLGNFICDRKMDYEPEFFFVTILPLHHNYFTDRNFFKTFIDNISYERFFLYEK